MRKRRLLREQTIEQKATTLGLLFFLRRINSVIRQQHSPDISRLFFFPLLNQHALNNGLVSFPTLGTNNSERVPIWKHQLGYSVHLLFFWSNRRMSKENKKRGREVIFLPTIAIVRSLMKACRDWITLSQFRSHVKWEKNSYRFFFRSINHQNGCFPASRQITRQIQMALDVLTLDLLNRNRLRLVQSASDESSLSAVI